MSTLMFAFEDDAPRAGLAQETDGMMLHHMKYLVAPLTDRAAKLKRDVELCTSRHILREDEMCSPKDLAAALAARGYAVALNTSAGGGSGVAAFRNLRHTFITIAAPPCNGGSHQPHFSSGQAASARPDWWAAEAAATVWAPTDADDEAEAASPEDAQLVADPHFACQFVVASPSPRYAALQRLLPQTFVGTMEQLEHVVEWVCREMEWSFKSVGQALPPWREYGSMLSKWRPRSAAQQVCMTAAVPAGSPRAGGCCCCQGAGAARAMAAAGVAHAIAAAAVAKMPPAAQGSACNSCTGVRSPCSVIGDAAPSHHDFNAFDSDMQQAAVLSALSAAPSVPQPSGGGFASVAAAGAARRTSLLSRSLEAAGLSPRGSSAAARQLLSQRQLGQAAEVPLAGDWWQPRVHAVRRTT